MKPLSLLLALALSAAGFSQNTRPFTLTGSLHASQSDVRMVYIQYTSGDKRVTDSSAVKDGKYAFTGQIAEPLLAGVRIAYTHKKFVAPRDAYSVFLEPKTISASHTDTSFSSVKISGSRAHDEFEKLNAAVKPYGEKLQGINAQYAEARKAGNQAEVERLTAEYYKADEELRENAYAAFVKSNPSSPVALYALQRYIGSVLEPSKVEPVFNTLAAPIRESVAGKKIQDRIEIAKKTEVGQIAPDFTQNDTLGKPVSLSSLRGKYLLVDFWASWCGPCRQENPNVVLAYNKYKSKGFDILGVSLDDNDKEAWINAIHKDNLTWTHVSDLKYWNNAVAKQYGIQAIPQNYLLDPNGRIIAKNLRGEKLQEKLAEIFAGK